LRRERGGGTRGLLEEGGRGVTSAWRDEEGLVVLAEGAADALEHTGREDARREEGKGAEKSWTRWKLEAEAEDEGEGQLSALCGRAVDFYTPSPRCLRRSDGGLAERR
jgi:hypothetical protein